VGHLDLLPVRQVEVPQGPAATGLKPGSSIAVARPPRRR
jgi:hypothetical protein